MSRLKNELVYAWRVIFHPFDGFWSIKRERRGSLLSAMILLVLLCFTHVIRVRELGFLFTPVSGKETPLLSAVLEVLAPFFLWCVANWCLTTLMDGEGSFRDIVICTAYAFVPLMLLNLPITLFSRFSTLEESAFYQFFVFLAMGWSCLLLFFGNMTIHQYSLTKTVLTVLLSLLVMALIVFLAILFFDLLQQVFAFGYAVYKEVAFRL